MWWVSSLRIHMTRKCTLHINIQITTQLVYEKYNFNDKNVDQLSVLQKVFMTQQQIQLSEYWKNSCVETKLIVSEKGYHQSVHYPCILRDASGEYIQHIYREIERFSHPQLIQ